MLPWGRQGKWREFPSYHSHGVGIHPPTWHGMWTLSIHPSIHACICICMAWQDRAPPLEWVLHPGLQWPWICLLPPRTAAHWSHWSLQPPCCCCFKCARSLSHHTIFKLTPCVITTHHGPPHTHSPLSLPSLHPTPLHSTSSAHQSPPPPRITLHSTSQVCTKAAPDRLLPPGMLGIASVSRFFFIPATHVL
jgi:hypothetical protein